MIPLPHMKVLIISSAFFPENSPRAFRATELVKEMCRQGHTVSLMTIQKPAHLSLSKEFGFNIIDLGARKYAFLKRSSNKLIDIMVRAINRLMSLSVEYPDIELMFKVKRALKPLSGFDLLISIAVPHPIHWGTGWARTKEHPIATTWVADCGDPYTLVTTDSFRKPSYFGYIEKMFCRKCDYISIPKIEMKINFFPEFDAKMIEIPQGFNLNESRVHLLPYQKHPVPTFAFSGNFIPGNRDPRPLLEYLVQSNLDFKFYVFTKIQYMVTPYLERAKGRIILSDYIPREELLGFLSTMDFVINITYDPQYQVPSKLIDYLITNRPILNIDKKLDTANVDRFLQGDSSGRFNALRVDRYDISNVCKKFTDTLKE